MRNCLRRRFPGCDCAAGFVGDRCEIWAEAKTDSSPTSEGRSRTGLKISMFVLFVFAVVIFLGSMAMRYRKRHRYFRGETTDNLGHQASHNNFGPVTGRLFSDRLDHEKNLAPRDDVNLAPHAELSPATHRKDIVEPLAVMVPLESTQGDEEEDEEDGPPRIREGGDQLDAGDKLDAVALSDDEII